jgi:hypothetical protein
VDEHIVESSKLLIWSKNTRQKKRKKKKKGEGEGLEQGEKGEVERRREHICSRLLSNLFSKEKGQETASRVCHVVSPIKMQ